MANQMAASQEWALLTEQLSLGAHLAPPGLWQISRDR